MSAHGQSRSREGRGARAVQRAGAEAGAAVLEVADSANKRGCDRDAKELYDFVVRNFAGLGYAELRQRATAGIKRVRAKG